MGRSPDYLNVTLAGFAGRADVFGAATATSEGAANLVRFHREAMLARLRASPTPSSTPRSTRRCREVDAGRRRGRPPHRRRDGRRHRGARRPGAGHARARSPTRCSSTPASRCPADADRLRPRVLGADDHARPKLLCRDSSRADGDAFDHPFSSRFDEQDAVVDLRRRRGAAGARVPRRRPRDLQHGR